jgi:hypothetical protein
VRNIIGAGPAVKPAATTTVQKQERHDGLCITQTASYGMAFCWCNKPCCWHPEGQRRTKKRGSTDPDAKSYREPAPIRLKGRCICRDCPCHDGLYLPSPTVINAASQDPPSKRTRGPRRQSGA